MDQNRPNRPSGIPPSMRRPAHSAHPQAATRPQAAPAPKPTPPPVAPKKMPFAHIVAIICLLVITLVVVIGALFMLWQRVSASAAIRSSQYQAVFLSNNMVYFGKMTELNDESIKLSDVFYLQVQNQSADKTQATTAQPQFSLTKLGGELHGPEDAMFINKREIVFWENLKNDGKVVQEIQKTSGNK